MAKFKKKKNKIEESTEKTVDVSSNPVIDDGDDFDLNEEASTPSRDEFHKMAKENLLDAIAEGDITINETDSASDDNDTVDTEVNNIDSSDFDVPEDDDDIDDMEIEEPEEEKIPMGVRFKEFLHRHIVAVRVTVITLGVILLALIGIYIYGCNTLTPGDVMGRNIYIEDINVSGLTYDEALIKVKNATLLKNRDLKLISNGKAFIIDGTDAGLKPKIEDTVDLAMRYGKTNNILIDGLANTLQYFFPHKVLPMANIDETIIREKLKEFGIIIHGELVEHKMEIDDDYVICTPGHSGFSGNVDEAYYQVVEAINNENYSRIRVTLSSAAPQDLTYEKLVEFAASEPQDAHYQIVNGETTVIAETPGRTFDENDATAKLKMVKEGGVVINIPFNKTEPKIKKEDLNDQLFNATLGSYTTTYAAGGNRGQNVAIAASKINNVVILPGEVFSFNDTVGPRSSANGFKPAQEYSNGQTVIGIGGGTCQVSTTLYNAVLYSDLAIVSRLNHMFAIGYAPLGQDATVSDSGVDFKFSNNTDHPIKITAVTGGGRITVSIIGTARDVKRTVKIENIVSYVGGDRSVRSYRYVYDPDGKLIRKDDLGRSYYMAHGSTVADPNTQTPAPAETTSEAPSENSTPQTGDTPQQPADTPQQPVDTPSQPAEPPAPVAPAPQAPAEPVAPVAPAAPAAPDVSAE